MKQCRILWLHLEYLLFSHKLTVLIFNCLLFYVPSNYFNLSSLPELKYSCNIFTHVRYSICFICVLEIHVLESPPSSHLSFQFGKNEDDFKRRHFEAKLLHHCNISREEKMPSPAVISTHFILLKNHCQFISYVKVMCELHGLLNYTACILLSP